MSTTPVAVIGSGFQLLYCRAEDWSKGLKVGDFLYTLPPGWVMVPAEPTPEMLKAACDAECTPVPMWDRMKAIHTAMIAAAPKEPA